MPTFSRHTRSGQFSTPKTVLGFYAGVLVILEAGLIGAIAILATESALYYLIPWILAFGALLLVALIGVVVAMNVRDPTKLQLGEVSGKDFLEHQQVMRGDSIMGEYVGMAPAATSVPEDPARLLLEVEQDGDSKGKEEDSE